MSRSISNKGSMRKALLAGAVAMMGSMLVAPIAEGAFPGANGKIVFTSLRDGNYEIYVMNADKSAQTNLTNNGAIDWQPAFSSDGSKIAFTSYRAGLAAGAPDVYVMNADGSALNKLTSAYADVTPSWSPDGSKIAFSSNRDGDYDIYVMNADGSGATNISANDFNDATPVFSPNGNKIAFASTMETQHFELYVMNSDGTGVTRLTNDAADGTNPDWSPDGSKIVFDRNFDVMMMNADGTGVVNLTNHGAGDVHPAFSPDGTRVLFATNRDFNYEIYNLSLADSSVSRMTEASGHDFQPDWASVPPPPPPPPSAYEADAVADTVLNGPTNSKSGRKTLGLVVTNVGTEALTTSEVMMVIEVNGAPASGTVGLQNPPASVAIDPGESHRFVFQWEFGKATVSPGSTVTYAGSVTVVGGEANLGNNSDTETDVVK